MLELKLGSLTSKQNKFKLERDRLLEKYYASRRSEEEEKKEEEEIREEMGLIDQKIRIINEFNS